MPLGAYDVERYAGLSGFEVAPNVHRLDWSGDQFAVFPPSGYPDGRVAVWTVPAGVASITYQLFGAMGGQAWDALGDDLPSTTPIMHDRLVPVTTGDVLTFVAGGPASFTTATRGNGPFWGGDGTPGSIAGGAGGGASALYLNDTLLALSPGGGGYYGDAFSGPWSGPSSSYPTGSAGSVGRGESAPTPPGIDVVSGGGGGAPPGAAGVGSGGGGNGGSVGPAAHAPGPASPTWAEIGIDPDTQRGAKSRVRVFFYVATPSGWAIDEARF